MTFTRYSSLYSGLVHQGSGNFLILEEFFFFLRHAMGTHGREDSWQ